MSALQTGVRVPAGFAGEDAPDGWPRPRLFPRPESLARPVDALPGVGTVVKKKLAKLGLERVEDLLSYRPFRYEDPADEKEIAELLIDEEAVIDVDGLRRQRQCRRGLVQPALAREAAPGRRPCAAARPVATARRFPRQELRHRRARRDGGLRAGVSGE
ncbi:MAG: hypothetical protein E6G67_11455 [Actinobacteria bacterium]|nr:MAG: hypothetical protein E6G67_11455 [Actinomycetota bacterium]